MGVKKVHGPVVGCVRVKVRTAPLVTEHDLIGNIIYDWKETIRQGKGKKDVVVLRKMS